MNGKSNGFQIWPVAYIQRVHPNESPLKLLEKRECGRIQGLPTFWGYPQLSQEREKLLISNLASRPIYIKKVYPKSIKNFREKGAWAYPGTAQFFRVPPIISGVRNG